MDHRTNSSHFVKYNIPIFDFDNFVFPRSGETNAILSAIQEICQGEQSPSIIVLTGQQPVGKTALLARLLSADENADILSKHCRLSTILWLDNLGQNKKKSFYLTFYRELVRVKILKMPQENIGWEKKPRYLGKMIDLIFASTKFLVVLDNVRQLHETLENIVRLNSSSTKFVIAASAQSDGAILKSNYTLFKVIHLKTLPTKEVGKLVKKIPSFQPSLLERFCKITGGYPYIIDVLLRFFASNDDPKKTTVSGLLDMLEAMPKGVPTAQRVEVALHRLVYRILKENLERSVAKKYLDLLVFSPATYFEIDDLTVLWRCNCNDALEIVEKFRQKGLVQRILRNDVCLFTLPNLLHGSAAKCCSRIGQVANVAEHLSNTIDGNVIGEAIVKKREQFLKQIAFNVDAKTLAFICKNRNQYDETGKTFLHQLYSSDWNQSEGVSFRLIAKFLKNFQKAGLNIADILMLPDNDSDCALLLIVKNNYQQLTSPEHQVLYELVAGHGTLFKTKLNFANDRKYWHDEACNGDEINGPLITAAIKGGDKFDVDKYLALDWLTLTGETPCNNSSYDINQFRSRNGATALIAASANGNEEIARRLMSLGADVNAVDKCGSTALIEAAYFGHVEIVRLLLEKLPGRVKVNAQNLLGVDALMAAAQHGFLEIVRLLKVHGANIELRNENGANCLIVAAQNGHFYVVQFLLSKGADTTMKTNGGTTAMMAACQNGFVEIVDLLLSNGIGLDEKDQTGNTPLMIAAQNGHRKVVELIASKTNSATVNAKNDAGVNALMLAIQKGHLEIAELLLAKFGADVNSTTIKRVTPLMLSALIGDLDAVKLLLASKADVSAKDEKGVTALMLATLKGHYNAAKYLVEHKADVDGKDNDGVTCLMAACLGNWVDIVDLLLRHNAAVNIRNNKGSNALMAAAQGGDLDTVRALTSHPAKADINAADNDGMTALMIASRCGHYEIVRFLLEISNAKHNLVNRRTKAGETALLFALKNGHINIARLLISKGADDKDSDGNNIMAMFKPENNNSE